MGCPQDTVIAPIGAKKAEREEKENVYFEQKQYRWQLVLKTLSFYKYTTSSSFNFGGRWVEPREREQICKLARKTPQAAEAAGCWVEKAALWVQLNNHLACPTVFDQTSTWQVLSICSIVEPWKVLEEEKGWVWIYYEQPHPSSFFSSLSSFVNLIDNFWKILMAVLAYASGESRNTDLSRLPASAL